ncbi:integrator complex subunit 2-domain-containing protein [Gamsiella multidivaricata]|uniref:integrator complex subunit 2-domain-containing protein n=1 Tax=Gamsiella multidivaricata TaxID=101098 RepID=UPI00221F518E|nr:integrator complex subunit 2-domain-containing protein [Gamsiella multidivaricata]KAI7821159.1 integrator complex subunit 2-domain-containing protein [Gamsiella multidivaricata]
MTGASEAFRLIETGGDPRLHPALDYTLCLPLLLSRYSFESVPFLARFPQARTVLKYLDLDYRLIQHQVKEELHLQKQGVNMSTTASRARLFETGTAEERARTVLVELETLMRRHDEESQTGTQLKEQDSTVLSNPMYYQEVSVLLATFTLRCKNPLLNVQAIIQSLRWLQDSAPLITYIIANHPLEFLPTIESLLETTGSVQTSKAIILRLCKLAEHKIWNVRQWLVDRKVFPNLAIELSIEHCHDEICFMNRILRGQPEWLTSGMDPVTKTSLTSIMEFIFSSLNDELTSQRPDHISVIRLLRILSGMVGLMSLALSTEQLEISLGVLEMIPIEPSTIDVKICFILMCAAQILKYSQSRLERVLHYLMTSPESPRMLSLLVWLQAHQLLKVDDFASKALSMNIVIPRAGLMELSTLFSSLFSSAELASCALGIGRRKSYIPCRTAGSPVPLKSSTPSTPSASSSTMLAPAFATGCNASELRSTANFLVGYLLQQDVFHKSAIDVRSWVMEQIQASTIPLDANMIHLLRSYTAAAARSKHISRIPEHDIRAFFSNPCEDLTPAKVLLVLYMLMNNDICLSNFGNNNSNTEENRVPTIEYDATLLEYVQIRKVILYVQNFQGGMAFQAVQPMFLKLVNAQFPELFDVTTLLMEEGLATTSWTKTSPDWVSSGVGVAAASIGTRQRYIESKEATAVMEPHFKAIAQHIENPDAAVKGYHTFQRLSQPDRQGMAKEIVQASLPSLLNPSSHPAVLEAFKKTWDQLNSVMPHDLWAMTIHALIERPASPTSSDNQESKGSQQTTQKKKIQEQGQPQHQEYYTFEWLVQDPLLLFKVDFRVFRSPIIFRLFVQILGAVMVGSRHWFRKQFQASQSAFQSQQSWMSGQVTRRQFKEVNLSAMLYIQDSVLIQLMLETCQARAEDIVEPFVAIKEAAQETVRRDGGTHAKTKKELMDTGKNKDAFACKAEGVSDALKEIRTVTFNFLHQLFIDHKIFPKLLHFQGYAIDLIPITVAGIDSIHVCLDFLQEILFASVPLPMSASSSVGSRSNENNANTISKADAAPQVFALRLAVQLCERFPLPHTRQMAIDFILPRLRELAISTGFSKEVLESAVVLAKGFPTLGSDIMEVLRETSGPQDKMALARTVDAISQALSDPTICDKSLL